MSTIGDRNKVAMNAMYSMCDNLADIVATYLSNFLYNHSPLTKEELEEINYSISTSTSIAISKVISKGKTDDD